MGIGLHRRSTPCARTRFDASHPAGGRHIGAAGLRRKPEESRLDLIHRNVDLFLSVLEQAKFKENAYLVVVSNPVDVLTYAAACTERLRLACAVFVLPLHNPLHLAKAISSLDCLSHGRVEVGVVTGGRGRPFEAFGVDPDKPVARFNEALALMKACWTEREINFDGRLWKLQGASMEPKPVQKPHPPVWFGGSAPAGMRRAVRRSASTSQAASARLPPRTTHRERCRRPATRSPRAT